MLADAPRHPEIAVKLVGTDRNAWSIISLVGKALREAGIAEPEIGEFRAEAMSGDYDNVLTTCMNWVSVS